MKTKLLSFLMALGLSCAIYRSNHSLELSFYKLKSDLLLKPFRVIQLSDLHIPYSGFKLKRLLNELKRLQPDLILMTGDTLDRQALSKDITKAQLFFDDCEKIATVISVSGNHDYKFNKHLRNHLFNEKISLNEYVQVIGVNPFNPKLPEIQKDKLTLVLSHYPIPLNLKGQSYQFSGHAHGGQFRLKNQGLVGPDQGLLPKYTKGYYPQEKMFVSAGLGASPIPLRINNPNHVIIVDFVV
jgi:predicted MPP superfamily phosphohydrolase